MIDHSAIFPSFPKPCKLEEHSVGRGWGVFLLDGMDKIQAIVIVTLRSGHHAACSKINMAFTFMQGG